MIVRVEIYALDGTGFFAIDMSDDVYEELRNWLREGTDLFRSFEGYDEEEIVTLKRTQVTAILCYKHGAKLRREKETSPPPGFLS